MDPVTTAFSVAYLILNSADDIALLISRLTDRQRELADAERDRRAASDRLLNPGEPERMAEEGGHA